MNISAISRCNQSEAALDRPANFSNFKLRKFFCGCARRWIEKLLNSPRNEGRSGGGFSVSFEFMASGAGHLHLNPILVVVGVGSFVLSCLLLSCSSGWNGVKCYSFNGQLVIWINLNFPLFVRSRPFEWFLQLIFGIRLSEQLDSKSADGRLESLTF